MFVDFLSVWLKSLMIKPDSVNGRYITISGNNCMIKIWYYGKVEIKRNKKFLRSFYFNEKTIKKYMLETK